MKVADTSFKETIFWAHLIIDSTGHIVFMIAYILCSSCFCEIWALCVTWINYDHLYYIYIKLINIVIMMMMMIIIMIQSSPYGYLTLWHRIVFSLVKDTDIKEIQYVDILDTFYCLILTQEFSKRSSLESLGSVEALAWFAD